MLQIISGRFFGGGQVEERDSDAVLYSDLSWPFPLQAAVAELRPVDVAGRSVSAYVVRYTNRYQKRDPSDIIKLAPGDAAIDQFRLLCSFWFRAFFHTDRNHVELLCRAGPRDAQDITVPRLFVPRFFDAGLRATQPEADGFVEFVAKVLAMPRAKYRLLMDCLTTFFDSLEALGTNFDLAYSMMVYLLEALCQAGDGYVPTWPDYDQKVKEKLDIQLATIEAGVAEAIRGALLESAHLKLMKRFVGFVVDNVTDEFFTTQAEGLTRALPKSQLEQALKNLYQSRSGFVHELRKVQEHLRVPITDHKVDFFEWEHEPQLTFPGLVRLVHHVLSTFIRRQPTLEREDYPAWRKELPGMIEVQLAPRLWIGQVEGFTPDLARHRFGAFVQHLASIFAAPEPTIPNMLALMEKIEQLVPGSSAQDRMPMLAMYYLYHAIAPVEMQRPNWMAFLEKYKEYSERCSIELLSFWPILRNVPMRWPVEQCVAAFEEYQRRRYKPKAVHLPVAVEVMVMAAIANLYLDGGDRDSFVRWVDRATLDAAGHKPIQEMLLASKADNRPIDTRQLVGLSPLGQTDEGGIEATNEADNAADVCLPSSTEVPAETALPPEGDVQREEAQPVQTLKDLKNIGTAIARKLEKVGIRTRADLTRVGPVAAFKLVRSQEGNATVSILYALHAALEDIDRAELSPEVKERLRQAVENGGKE